MGLGAWGCDEQGYSYVMGLVRVAGSVRVHFQPRAEDVIWMTLPPEIQGPHLGYGSDEMYARGWAARWPTTGCGLAIAGPATPNADQNCLTCWHAGREIWPQLVAQLAARFAERFPAQDRAALLADFTARQGG